MVSHEDEPAHLQVNIAEARHRIENIMSRLLKHPLAALFQEPLDPAHNLFDKIKHHFVTLSLINLSLRVGANYKDSNQFARAVRTMILVRFKLVVNSAGLTSEQLIEKQNAIMQFSSDFEAMFKGNESLVIEKRTSPTLLLEHSKTVHARVQRALNEKRQAIDEMLPCNNKDGKKVLSLSYGETKKLKNDIASLSVEQRRQLIDMVK